MPIAFITAKTGKNVKAMLNLAQSMYKQAQKRVGTGTLNRALREAVDAHPPASRENRTPRIYYATQVDVEPPTIVLFVNSAKLFDATYQRYLLNVFREKLPFRDIPIKLYMRSRKQEEPGSRSPSRSGGGDVPGDIGRGLSRASISPSGSTPSRPRPLGAIPPSRGQRAPGRPRRLTASAEDRHATLIAPGCRDGRAPTRLGTRVAAMSGAEPPE